MEGANASIAVRNATIVTMDEGKIIAPGTLVVDGSRIIALDSAGVLANRYRAHKEIDASGKLVLPGLIDAHYHTCQQMLRGTLASIWREEQVRFPVWKNYLVPFESLLSEEDVYLSGLMAYTNMIRVGTTCVSEHGGRHPDQMARAMQDVGIRGLLAESTIDVPDAGFPANMVRTTDDALARNVELVRRWNGQRPETIRGCFSLRQVIACTPVLFREIARQAERYDALVQTHLAEGTYEVEYTLNRYHLRPAEYLESLDALSPRLLAAHSVLLSDREVELYARYGVKVAHCPSGNFTGLGMTKLPLMRRLGIHVGLGSDGASGGTVDLFEAMNISFIGQTLHYGTPYLDRRVTSWRDCVHMATLGGARAVRWDDAIGSLAVGKRADLIILDPSHLDVQPLSDDPYYSIVKCLRGRDVETVMVNGRVVLENRKMVTIDEDALRRQMLSRLPEVASEFRGFLKRQRQA
jgi:5-methylthioadenosine/S-adenosylhomocysteine deaminase